ncbi:hypothetical protein BHR79_09815 [Methanohalophilus halophilus]|uniref:Uncharacterized protein n=2 Tax=Methanohalophilus halophilus TaxID=2177 RepID=A0A1L3Q4H6_9EURY|nr:hypothetical protein BHR79_09815 [Methanohalophilus halophilus]RNI08916.1 hypothetical protein EFE40_05445 [Methanohalophilus halophilus]SDW38533.1 hypothetical protein SAMN04515625_0883 [Methanohalophilus halophilus]
MQQTFPNLQSIYHNYKLLPLILSFAVLIDYFFTFYFAPDLSTIMKYEYSPTLLFALRNDIFIPYMMATFTFYYIGGYLILKNLEDSEIYSIGVYILLMMSLTHILGGLSWYVLNPIYSNMVFTMSRISIVVAIGAFIHTLITNPNST